MFTVNRCVILGVLCCHPCVILPSGVFTVNRCVILSPGVSIITRVLCYRPCVISSPVVLYGMHLGGGGGVGVVVDHVKCWYRLRCYLWGWVGVWTESGVGGFGVWMLVAALLLV